MKLLLHGELHIAKLRRNPLRRCDLYKARTALHDCNSVNFNFIVQGSIVVFYPYCYEHMWNQLIGLYLIRHAWTI